MLTYNNYLKGIYDLSLGTQKDNFRAIEDFEAAINEDPAFAPAYSGLANIYTYQAGDMLSPTEAFPKALGYVAKSLELDRDLAEAHNSRAILAFQYDWNWELAERGFKLSIELNPSYSLAYSWCAWFLAFIGRAEEAIPIAIGGPGIGSACRAQWYGCCPRLIRARRFEEGIQEMSRLQELYPKNAGLHTALAFCFTQAGKFEYAIRELESARKMALVAGGTEEDYLQYSISSWEYASTSFA
jgi:tetratricopeptide (TPR) repeat protein